MTNFTPAEAIQLIHNIDNINIQTLTSALTALTLCRPLTDDELDTVIESLMIIENLKGGC